MLLKKHAKAMRGRIAELSKKGYQETIEGEFDHVVMFHPKRGHGCRCVFDGPGFDGLCDEQIGPHRNPVTMLGLLRTVALYWQQHALAEGANEIYEVSRELYKRVNTTVDHFVKVGGHLSKAAKAYDATMNSYGRMVLPQGRRLEELKVSETLQGNACPNPRKFDHPKE